MNIYGYEIVINNPPHVFGDSTHETTRFLLYFLNRYVTNKSYIDAGCGTGILSIFASKHKASSVTAIDADPHAIKCINNNIKTNSVNINIIQQEIQKIQLISADIVTANMARFEMLFLLPYITKMINDNGLLIITWYKELPKDVLYKNFNVIDYIEGVEYDAYVLQKK